MTLKCVEPEQKKIVRKLVLMYTKLGKHSLIMQCLSHLEYKTSESEHIIKEHASAAPVVVDDDDNNVQINECSAITGETEKQRE